jgi:hypothetical protein
MLQTLFVFIALRQQTLSYILVVVLVLFLSIHQTVNFVFW